ncbi:MAG: hypothetical protein GXY14_13410 [Spirochaetes bacterium]|nr:hypothetical protein [Spirochaetota bacterium]
MEVETLITGFGMAASIIMPLFNIPLVIKLWKRRSSSDISLTWTLGIWGSIVVMTPAALISADPVFRIFGVMNLILFSIVAFSVLKFRK